MFDALLSGLALILQWPTAGYLILGVLIGIWLGAVPGLGGIVGIVILLPFTYGMDAAAALALLLGLYAVTATSDSIPSIMLGVPGTAASQATILDGHPLAKKGQAARALGAALFVSGVGGVIGGIALALALPLALPVILMFGSPDYFLFGAFGLVLVGALSGSSLGRGLAATSVGLLVSQIGYPVRSSEPRYWFGEFFLIDGLPLVAVVLGLFALPELMELSTRSTSIARKGSTSTLSGGMLEGVRDVIRHRWLALRSALLGVFIGMLPGLGAAIADWIAYGHAVQSAKDRSQFGKGDIRGVIAPEATNNALNGGALIPTVALGIPGSAGMAVLLGAFLMQGLVPGPAMLTSQLDVTYSMVWSLILANVLAAGLLFMLARPIARASFIDGHLIVPIVLVFVFMGAWLAIAHPGSLMTLVGFGALGILFKRARWPRPPLILGFVLGPILENAYILTLQAYSFQSLVTRPITVGLFVILCVAALAVAIAVRRGTTIQTEVPQQTDEGVARPDVVEPVLSLLLAVLWAAVCAWALAEALSFRRLAGLFPQAITVLGLFACVWVVLKDGRHLSRLRRDGLLAYRGWGQDRRLVQFMLWIGAMLGLVVLIGQPIALTLSVAAYLWLWGGYRLPAILAYAAFTLIILFGFYGEVLGIRWIRPVYPLI